MERGGRGRYWTEAEVTALLDILIQHRLGPVLFHMLPRRNEPAFRLASRELARLNYERTSTQIRSKFKTLRQNFNRCLYYFGEHAEERQQAAYWNQLLQLWIMADRPDPAHLFPAGAGPARHVGQRRGQPRQQQEPEQRGDQEAQPREVQQQEIEGGEARNDRQADEGGEELVPEQPLDIMREAVPRGEMEQWIAILQEVVARVGVLEQHVLPAEGARPPQRRRRRRR